MQKAQRSHGLPKNILDGIGNKTAILLPDLRFGRQRWYLAFAKQLKNESLKTKRKVRNSVRITHKRKKSVISKTKERNARNTDDLHTTVPGVEKEQIYNPSNVVTGDGFEWVTISIDIKR